MNFSFSGTDSYFTLNDSYDRSDPINGSGLEFCELVLNESQEENVNDDLDMFFKFIICGLLLNVTAIFGIVGNTISMIILSRPQMRSSINQLLIGLARCDISLIITSILLFGLPSIYSATGYFQFYYYSVRPFISPIVYPIAMISQTISVYLTLVVTLERFVAVCHPLRARSLCTVGRARSYMVVVIVFSILYNITRFWEIVAVQCLNSETNLTIADLDSTPLRKNALYIKVYINWMYLIFMYFIPFGCLAILNTAIYKQVRKANQERQRLSRLQKKEIGLATMLLCIVVVFLLCNLIPLVSNVLEAFWNETNDILVEVGNLMIAINSSINFVIYVIFGEKFRKLFFKIFFPHGLGCCGAVSRDDETPQRVHENAFLRRNSNESDNSSICRHVRPAVFSNGKTVKCDSRKSRKLFSNRAFSLGPHIYNPTKENGGSFNTTSTSI